LEKNDGHHCIPSFFNLQNATDSIMACGHQQKTPSDFENKASFGVLISHALRESVKISMNGILHRSPPQKLPMMISRNKNSKARKIQGNNKGIWSTIPLLHLVSGLLRG